MPKLVPSHLFDEQLASIKSKQNHVVPTGNVNNDGSIGKPLRIADDIGPHMSAVKGRWHELVVCS
jgi:hypothetical protein